MEALIKQISQKYGISEDQTKKVVESTVSYIKSKLPDAISSHIDSALSGQTIPDSLLKKGDDLKNNASDMLGKLF
jgi:hypothetical protein